MKIWKWIKRIYAMLCIPLVIAWAISLLPAFREEYFPITLCAFFIWWLIPMCCLFIEAVWDLD